MSRTRKILLVDDEPKIVEVLEAYLKDEGFSVSRAYDGTTALLLFGRERPDLVVLDLKLPDIPGGEVFQALRGQSDTPIIILTSRGGEIDRIVGLELGADDYVAKPFSPREVVARIKAVLRRTQPSLARPDCGAAGGGSQAQAGWIRVGDVAINPREHEVRVRGEMVALTPTEFRLLEVLASQPGRTFTRAQLLEATRSEDLEIFDRTLDRHIANLRRKIEPEPAQPRYVVTVFGVGYKMPKPPPAEGQGATNHGS